jgi:protein-L-isoaspartate(D-aspartate) O-methyltransferase
LHKTQQRTIIVFMTEQQNKDEFELSRRHMLEYNLKGRGIKNPRLLKVMEEIPRQDFVPDSHRSQAYKDGPLPIELEQTISQPYIVALMTQELHISQDCIVLEIGTGSGYQTAILSKLAKKVYTIERLDELSKSAQIILGKLGCDNIEFLVGDGSEGWPESKMPESGYFDRIMVTAAVPSIPNALKNQLADSGLMVIPVGSTGIQELILCEKRGKQIIETNICDVRFVKLFGKYGFD